MLLSGLLTVMMRRTMKKGEIQKLEYGASRDIDWQCQSLGRVWTIALRHDGHQTYSWSSTQPLLTPLLQHLCLVLKLVTKSTRFPTTSVISIARVVSDVLISMTPPLSTPLEGILSESLLIFASLLWKYPKIYMNFKSEINTLLSGIWQDEEKFRPFGEELKVVNFPLHERTRLVLTSCRNRSPCVRLSYRAWYHLQVKDLRRARYPNSTIELLNVFSWNYLVMLAHHLLQTATLALRKESESRLRPPRETTMATMSVPYKI